MAGTGAPALDTELASAVWHAVLPTDAEIRRARRTLQSKALAIGAVTVSSYIGLVIMDVSLPLRFACAVGLVLGLIATATCVMHDANHGAFSAHRWLNRLVAYTADALGASSWLWRVKHNVFHHGNTNVDGADTDISQAPFARLTAGQPWRRWHRHQHIYLWFLYGFMTLKNVVIGDLGNLSRNVIGAHPLGQRRSAAVAGKVIAGKLCHLGWAVVVPLVFNPWWKVLLFYVACSWAVGLVLAVVFQLAHCVDVAEFPGPDAPRRGRDFVGHQLLTTVDIRSPMPAVGHVFRWIVGGLDHQLEHHLAPRLPHTIYPLLARRFRSACDAAGLRYRLHESVVAAIASHARLLKSLASPPSADLIVGQVRR